MKLKKILVAAALVGLGGAAQADSPIFTDNFSTDTPGQNNTPTTSGWSIGNTGTVDTLGAGYFQSLCAGGTGNCVDLDGSTGVSGQLEQSINLNAGNTYLLNFDLGTNQRTAQTDAVTVSFGTNTQVFDITQPANLVPTFATFGVYFVAPTTGSYSFSFLDNSGNQGNNIGAILESAEVTPVPEMSTYAITLLGMAMLVGYRILRSRGATWRDGASLA